MGYLYQILSPQGSENPVGRIRKIVTASGDGRHQRNKTLWTQQDSHTNKLTDCGKCTGTAQVTLVLREVSNTRLHTSLAQKLAPTESQWVYEPLLRVSPMPSNRWSTQNKLHGIFKGPLSHSVLSGHFVLNLVGTYVFLFCIFGRFLCLRMCMSLCL